MSLTIEPKAELSEFEIQYLRDRGLNPDDYTLDADEEEAEDTQQGITSDGTNAHRAGELPADDEDEDDVPYSEWTKEELQAELKNRELKVSGDKPELVARLEEHDATLADGDA